MTAKKNPPCNPNPTTIHPIPLQNIIPVAALRQQMQQKPFTTVCPKPGVYRWWFPVEVWNTIKSVFPNQHLADEFQLLQRNIDENDYVALYFGKSNNLSRRIKQHVMGPNNRSTLRRSLKAILIHAFKGNANVNVNQMLNQILDKCYWEWDCMPCPEKVECEELCGEAYAYPLNIQNNHTVPSEWVKELKRLRYRAKGK